MAAGNGVHDDAQSRHLGQIRLGITGGIGSGKSYVAQMLQARWDVPVYDCDSEAKRLTAESDDLRTALTQLVGDHLWQQGQMQKPVLAAYLFASPEHAAQVNAIIHPAVRRDFLHWADAHSRSPVVAIESAILCESGFHTLVDSILLVDAPLEVRLQRAMLRDGASRQQVMARMARQDSAQARQLARFTVINDGGGDQLLQACLESIVTQLQAEAGAMQDNK